MQAGFLEVLRHNEAGAKERKGLQAEDAVFRQLSTELELALAAERAYPQRKDPTLVVLQAEIKAGRQPKG